MINHFTFNGTSTAQLGLIVSGVSIFGAGSRKVEKAGIPGRNGDLQIELGGFNNYTVRYTVSITKNFTTTAQQIREWLLESKGYCDLTDTYHPDEIRKACFNSDIEFTTSMLYKYGQASIQFDCLPERYLTTNTPITTTATADTTTDTTMSLNTVPTPLNISLNGNTTQEGSSGKNLYDIQNYIDTNIVAYGNGIKGTVRQIYDATANNITGIFASGQQYTVSLYARTDGETSTGTGLMCYFYYTDNTETHLSIPNNTTTNTKYTLTSTSGKTVSKFSFSYSSQPTNTWYVTDFMIEKGSTATAYEPHISPTNPQVIHNVSGDNEIGVTGKNILTPFIIGISINSNNGNEVPSVLGATTDYIPVDYDVNPNYYLSGISSTIHSFVCAYNSNKQFLGRTPSTFRNDITLPKTAYTSGTAQGTGDISYLRVTYYQQGTDTDASTANNYLTQLEVGSTATTYEPYTRQSYPLYLPVENLLPRRTTRTTNGVTFTVNTDGTITTSGTATANIYNALAVLNLPNDTYTMTGSAKGGSTSTYYMYTEPHYRGDTGNGVTFTDSITSCSIFVASGQNMDGKVFKPQIEKGSKANHYTPYGTTPIELNKIGTYQDYIYKNGSKWYVHKETYRLDLLSTYGYSMRTSGDIKYFTLSFGSTLPRSVNTFSGAFCNRFINGSTVTLGTFYITGTGSIFLCVPTDQTLASQLEFREWLSSNPTYAIIPLATATNTEITDTTLINQLNNIEKAYSYNGTTNILQVSNDNGFMLGVVSLHGSTFNSNYKGEPIITVNSTGLIYLNGEVMEVLSAPVTINCQTMQCYNGAVNMNNEVKVNDFPEIKIGENTVGSSMALTITPNNWRH